MYVGERLSEKQIATMLSISPNRVRRILDAEHVTRRGISEAVTNAYITRFGKKEYELLTDLDANAELLKMAGVMLYWGEGSKRGNTVAFTNSDPIMVATFLHFLRAICGIDEARLRATVHYYPDQDVNMLARRWSRLTKIPSGQFYKPFLHIGKRGTYGSRSSMGTISIQYSDKRLLRLIIGWIAESAARVRASR